MIRRLFAFASHRPDVASAAADAALDRLLRVADPAPAQPEAALAERILTSLPSHRRPAPPLWAGLGDGRWPEAAGLVAAGIAGLVAGLALPPPPSTPHPADAEQALVTLLTLPLADPEDPQ